MADFNEIQFEGKDGVTEAFQSVTSALKAAGYDVLVNEVAKNEYIPYSRFSEVISEKNTLSSQLTNANVELEKLKKASPDTKVQERIQELIQKNTALADQLKQSTIKSTVMSMAKDAIDCEDVFNALNKELVSVDENGNVTGVDTEIQRIREAKPHWFSKAPNKGGFDPSSQHEETQALDMNSAIRAMAGR